MNKFVISTDTTCDLHNNFCFSNNIDLHSLYYKFGDDEIYGGSRKLDASVFYDRMRKGEMPTTMATNPEDSKAIFARRINEGYDIIHVAFSSGLSSSFQNACIAAREVMDEHPGSRITVIDSLSASMGEGLLVFKAVNFANEGHDFDETVDYIEKTKLHISHQFTVDDLFHLHRGGRISKATAVLGTVVGIKPVMHMDDEGHLTVTGKVRGRKKSLASLVDNMFKTMGDHDNSTIMISHGDCLEDARFVEHLIREKLSGTRILINTVCPTIGAHSGPGTVALFFEADKR